MFEPRSVMSAPSTVKVFWLLRAPWSAPERDRVAAVYLDDAERSMRARIVGIGARTAHLPVAGSCS